jgi:hypothetical protein
MSKVCSIFLAVAALLTIAIPSGIAISAPISIEESLQLVQGCPRGYDFDYRTGRCYRDWDRDDYGYRYRHRRRYDDYPYGYHDCPPGMNRIDGRCIPSRRCPPGYNDYNGRCVPS